jgi:hypothetical protein
MENQWGVPLAAAGIALIGMFAAAWRSRARALARRLTALNSYAEREMARERRRKALERAQSFSTVLRARGKVRSPATVVGEKA